MEDAVEARNLAVRRGGEVVLQDVNLRIQPGTFVLLAGPSGGGKSTLLQALAGLLTGLPATEVTGSVRLAGLDVVGAPGPALARKLGFLFQRPEDQLLALDVASEVAAKPLHLGATPGEAEGLGRTALERLGAGHLWERETTTLSGGEIKRVALAAALATGPPVLFLDEPLGDLDPAGRRALAQDLARLPSGTTVVCATHRVEALQPLADRTLTVAGGTLRSGAPATPPTPTLPPGGPHREAALLRFRDVSGGPGTRYVLQDVTLDLAGGLVAVAGPNGAGKTTLLRMAAGLLEPPEGHVLLRGRDLASLDVPERARAVGYVPQDPDLLFFAPTAEDEVAFGPETLDVPVDAAAVLEAHGLGPRRHRHPHALSGGERERLAWAAALAHDPPVAVIDEPTTGLDATARGVLLQHLARVRRRGLALVATHDAELLALADRVLLLAGGSVVADGTPAEVLDPTRLGELEDLHPGLPALALPRGVQA